MIALSDADGTLRLYSPPKEENRDYNVTMVEAPGWTPMDVPCVRLDDLLAERGVDRVDLMKMDVEGAEPRVLAGGADRLGAGVVRHLIVEVNGPRLVACGSSPAAPRRAARRARLLPRRALRRPGRPRRARLLGPRPDTRARPLLRPPPGTVARVSLRLDRPGPGAYDGRSFRPRLLPTDRPSRDDHSQRRNPRIPRPLDGRRPAPPSRRPARARGGRGQPRPRPPHPA